MRNMTGCLRKIVTGFDGRCIFWTHKKKKFNTILASVLETLMD